MNKLAAIIDKLPLADLMLIQKDLEAGNIDKLLKQRIAEFDVLKTCPTCGRELGRDEQRFTIEFGPQGLRQRAYFDELDCLNYFVEKLHAQNARQNSRAGGDLEGSNKPLGSEKGSYYE